MSLPPTRLAGGALLTAAAGLTYAVAERRWYVLRHATVPVLAAGARPLRVLHLTDLHQLPAQEHRLAFVRRCLDAGPDMIAVTGDLLESDDSIDEVVDALADAALGRAAVAVLGSHDYWGATPGNPANYLLNPQRRSYGRRLDTDRLVTGLQQAGYELLDNRRATVKTAAGLIDILGLGDPHVALDRPEQVDWTTPSAEAVAQLGLVHAPYRRALDLFARRGVQLTLTGHTHGGQLRLPLVGALVNNSDLPLRQSRGLSRYGDMWLHVSAGLGHSRYAPVRFACRPEATILDLIPTP